MKRAPANHSWRRTDSRRPTDIPTMPMITSGPSPCRPGVGPVAKVELTTAAIDTIPSARRALGGPSAEGGVMSRNLTTRTVGRVSDQVIGGGGGSSPPPGGDATSTSAPMTNGQAKPMLCGMTLDSNDAVRIRGLRKAYGEHTALDGVDLTVTRGEVLALLGPNGAGKTTLVEILEGHRKADAGSVSVLGFDPAKRETEFRSRIGIVLQETGLDQAIQ